jgi:dipeptide/tripeptide permease
MGVTYIFAPAFGWLSDRRFGYFPVLCSAFALYVVGTIPICYTAARTIQHYDDNELRLLQGFYVVGALIATLSASAVRATLLPYMLEQLGDGSESHTVIVGLITASYFAINIGSVLAAIVGGYLWKEASFYNKSEYTGIFWTYILASLCLFLSFLLLVLWRKQYRSHEAERRAEYSPSLKDIFLTGCGCYRAQPGPICYDQKQLPLKSKEEEKTDQLNEHRQRLGVLVPVLFTLIFYYAVQAQLWRGFVDQLLHMDFGYEKQRMEANLSINNSMFSNYCTINSTDNHYVVAPPMLAGLDAVSVLLMIPIVWWVIRSMYVRWRKNELTMLDRVLIGMVLTLLACVTVTGVEVTRILCGHFHVICLEVNHDPILTVYSTVSPFIQIPQQLLVGLGEAFIGIAAREFVLSRAPYEFRCTAYGSIYFINGLSDLIGALSLTIMKQLHCYYREINLAETVTINSLIATEKSLKTWVYFVVLTALMLVGCIIFHAVKRRHKDVLRLARA